MNESNSRARKLVALAIKNKELHSRFKATTSGKRRKFVEKDEDYVPDSNMRLCDFSVGDKLKSDTKRNIRIISNVQINKPGDSFLSGSLTSLSSVQLTVKMGDTMTPFKKSQHEIESFVKKDILENIINEAMKRVEFCTIDEMIAEQNVELRKDIIATDFYEIENFIQKYILRNIIDSAMQTADLKLYTKTGECRKRKKYETTPVERKKQKLDNYVKNHNVTAPCNCKLKCVQKMSFERQQQINLQFWQLTKKEQRLFILNCFKKYPKKRHTTKKTNLGPPKKVYSYSYFLKTETGDSVQVCKVFLLSTLGFEKENDRILKNVRKTDQDKIAPKSDKRKHPSSRKIDRNIITDHINSFSPTISHYRREHAPNRKYLPSDITISLMYKCFKEKYPNEKLSYEVYRKEVSNQNISFTKLGHEECWDCERYEIHKKDAKHDYKNTATIKECDICKDMEVHMTKAIKARQEYQNDAAKAKDLNDLFVSADLQKVCLY